jgi:hypothetical protein
MSFDIRPPTTAQRESTNGSKKAADAAMLAVA